MRRATLTLATFAVLIASAASIAKADSGCFDGWRAQPVESACRGRSCADAGYQRRTPPKLPPWLMTRVASNAKPMKACAVAALPALRPAG